MADLSLSRELKSSCINNQIFGVVTHDDNILNELTVMRRCDARNREIELSEGGGALPKVVVWIRASEWNQFLAVSIPSQPASGVIYGEPYLNGEGLARSVFEQRISESGSEFLKELSGIFIAFLWEKSQCRFTICTDRLATQKIFIFRCGDTLLFSSNLAELLRTKLVPRVIDYEVVAQYLISSHPFDERSFIKNVSVCKPATFYIWERGRKDEVVYWKPEIGSGEVDGLDRWADRIGSALARAVEIQCKGSVLIPLTGGLDSRAIAAFLPRRGDVSVSSCTFGHSHCYDLRYGGAIAAKLKIPHITLPIADDFFIRDLEKANSLCDGEISIEALPMFNLLAAAEPGTVLLSGYLGDSLSGSNLIRLDEEGGRGENFPLIWQRYFRKTGFSEGELRDVLNADFGSLVYGKSFEKARDIFDALKANSIAEKIVLMKLATRQWRYTTYMGRVIGERYKFRAPFMDSSLMDVMLAMPLEYRLDQRAYRRMLVRFSPDLASLKEQKTRKSVTYSDKYGLHGKNEAARFINTLPPSFQWRANAVVGLCNGLLTRLSRGWLGSHNRDLYVHHAESIRSVSPEWFRSTLLESKGTAELFDRNEIERLLGEHMAGRFDHATKLNNILSFSYWLESV